MKKIDPNTIEKIGFTAFAVSFLTIVSLIYNNQKNNSHTAKTEKQELISKKDIKSNIIQSNQIQRIRFTPSQAR